MTTALTADERIIAERAALQLFGQHAPSSHMLAVLRGLGVPQAQAALFYPVIEARLQALGEAQWEYDARELAIGVARPALSEPEHRLYDAFGYGAAA